VKISCFCPKHKETNEKETSFGSGLNVTS